MNYAALEKHGVPRTYAQDIWRIPPDLLEEAQDDGTILAIRDMERAGIDIITDGEIRRESYSNRFALALDGIDAEHPGEVRSQTGRTTPVPRVVGQISRRGPVELRGVEFLLRQTDRTTKITLPGPFTLSQQAKNEFYADEEEMAMDYAAAVNAELRDLKASGVDVVQLDEPWVAPRPTRLSATACVRSTAHWKGIEGPTVVHLCFGYAHVVQEQAERLRLPAAARRHGRAADLDPGSAAEARPRRAGRPVRQADHVGRASTSAALTWKRRSRSPARIRAGLHHVAAERLIPAPDCGEPRTCRANVPLEAARARGRCRDRAARTYLLRAAVTGWLGAIPARTSFAKAAATQR